MRGSAAVLVIGVVLVACGGAPAPVVGPSEAGSTDHGAHDAQLDRVRAELESRGMTFSSSGPHHLTGTDAAGNQLDLVGVPVEQVVLTLSASDAEAAREAAATYLPFTRDLLLGPGPVWSWVADEVDCRAAGGAEGGSGCDTAFEQGPLTARFTDDGPEFWVVSIARSKSGRRRRGWRREDGAG